jgi:hypothetical protein
LTNNANGITGKHKMKPFTLLVAALATLLVGCATTSRLSGHAGTTRIIVSGASGAVLTGYYAQDGRRVALSNAVPWSFEVPRLSRVELRKAHPADAVVVNVRYQSNRPQPQISTDLSMPLPPGVVGTRVDVRNGLVATRL